MQEIETEVTPAAEEPEIEVEPTVEPEAEPEEDLDQFAKMRRRSWIRRFEPRKLKPN